ncbi:MAG TPA: AbrB/MazE/SpoVT family DNA-binding domain-containing protein [Limnobacter sp.]|nr:AbrB/MazE/SpoVT family DNA-binding domain-containing protein [Limnobacter sp.]
MSITAKVFMSGRSQALRLPAKLRLNAKEVVIEQIGADLWVHPVTPDTQNMGLWLAQFYKDTEKLPDDFLIDRVDMPAQERDWT